MTECPCRDNDVSENLEKWNMMNDPEGFQPERCRSKSKDRHDSQEPGLYEIGLLREYN